MPSLPAIRGVLLATALLLAAVVLYVETVATRTYSCPASHELVPLRRVAASSPRDGEFNPCLVLSVPGPFLSKEEEEGKGREARASAAASKGPVAAAASPDLLVARTSSWSLHRYRCLNPFVPSLRNKAVFRTLSARRSDGDNDVAPPPTFVPASFPRSRAGRDAAEDIRLFRTGGRLYGIGSRCHVSGPAATRGNIVPELLVWDEHEADPDRVRPTREVPITFAADVAAVLDSVRQNKNWAVLETCPVNPDRSARPGVAWVCAQSWPTAVFVELELDDDDGRVAGRATLLRAYDARPCFTNLVRGRAWTAAFGTGCDPKLRNTSAFVAWKPGRLLTLLHGCRFRFARARLYFTAVVEYDAETLMPLRHSPWMCFSTPPGKTTGGHESIQFASCLARAPDQELWVGVGINDRAWRLDAYSEDSVERVLTCDARPFLNTAVQDV